MSEPNYIGQITWYIVTSADQCTIPEFTFVRDNAPYFIGQAVDRRLFIFDRAAMIEVMEMWQAANTALEDKR